ncbi:hypothetical protein ES705_47518 [subsurface metagenome]
MSAADGNLLAKIYNTMASILEKYGLFLAIKDRLEQIEDSSDHISYLTNISTLIDF